MRLCFVIESFYLTEHVVTENVNECKLINFVVATETACFI